MEIEHKNDDFNGVKQAMPGGRLAPPLGGALPSGFARFAKFKTIRRST